MIHGQLVIPGNYRGLNQDLSCEVDSAWGDRAPIGDYTDATGARKQIVIVGRNPAARALVPRGPLHALPPEQTVGQMS